MMDQISLFDDRLDSWAMGARTTDPETSHQAAARRDRTTDRWRALRIHGENPDGLTDFELGELMNRQQTSAGKRRHEWTLKGGASAEFITATTRRRLAPSGSPAIVWQITALGVSVLNGVYE
jgi:hypothetical protein